jgi:hypothetical protein
VQIIVIPRRGGRTAERPRDKEEERVRKEEKGRGEGGRESKE